MASLKHYSLENGKIVSGEGSFRKGLSFPNLRSASEKPSLPNINAGKFELPRSNALNQFAPKHDVKQKIGQYLHTRNVNHDSLSLIPQPKSHLLQNHSSKNIGLSVYSPISPFFGGLNRHRHEKEIQPPSEGDLSCGENENQEETSKQIQNISSPPKSNTKALQRSNLKDISLNNVNIEGARFNYAYKTPVEKTQRANSNVALSNTGPSFNTLLQRLGRITNNPISLPNSEPTRGSEKAYGIIKGFGVCTNQGLVRNYNEDRVAIVLNILRPANRPKSEYWPVCNFFAVYDGHGGPKCADYLRNTFHQHVIKSPFFPSDPSEALKEAFEIADKEFIEAAMKDSDPLNSYDRSGSCALVALFVDEVVYISNVGDSRAIISQNQGQKRYALTRDHKPSDPQEQARIVQAGGKVYQNFPLGPNGKRLDLDPQANPFKVEIPFRVMPGRLSVSRTIGDIEAKLPQYGGNPGVVISEPETTTLKIASDHDFIILGCDGIFDKASDENMIQSVWDTSKRGREQNIHEASKFGAENVVREAMLQKSMDNVTAIVISFSGLERMISTQEPLQLQQNQPQLISDKKSVCETPINDLETKNNATNDPSLKSEGKLAGLDDLEIDSEKPFEDTMPVQKIKTARLDEVTKYSQSGKNYDQAPLLPDIRSTSYYNSHGVNSKTMKMTGPKPVLMSSRVTKFQNACD